MGNHLDKFLLALVQEIFPSAEAAPRYEMRARDVTRDVFPTAELKFKVRTQDTAPSHRVGVREA